MILYFYKTKGHTISENKNKVTTITPNKLKTNLELSISNKSNSSFKLRKSVTLNNSNNIANRKTETTNSNTNVNFNAIMKQDLQSQMPIYVNDNFYFLNELEKFDKLNETIIKSSEIRDDPVSPNVSTEKTTSISSSSSPSSSTSSTSKMRITSYSLNHQNQLELQQQQHHKNVKATLLSSSRVSNTRLNNSRTNLASSNSKTRLPINSNENKNSNVKLCRIIKSDQVPQPRRHNKMITSHQINSDTRNSIFISSASTLLTNAPDEEVLIKTNFSTNQNYFHDINDNDDECLSDRNGATKIVDQMASFIDELKDFIDDKLIDTTSQLELANQRISSLYDCFHFVAGEFSLLKFHNDELLKELKHFYRINGTSVNNHKHQNDAKIHKNSEKKSSETSSAISSIPVKSSKMSQKENKNRKNDLSYSSTE